MSLVDGPSEQKRKIRVAMAVRRALDHLEEVDAEVGADEDVRVSIARLREHLADVPQYVKDEMLRYFGPRRP